jgi:ATP-binding cassette subfamily C protein
MRGAWGRVQHMFRAIGELPERMKLPPPVGAVDFENVMVGAPGGQALILKAITLKIEPGKAVAVIGPSASGKSSFVRALVGVWPVASGTIRFDGSDIRHWDSEELGQYIGYLPQDVELFSGTIAENIARFREVDEAEVITAAKLAGVHELIQNLPGGYNTQIGDGGATLSGGQRQRVALARAVYGKPPYIVLDEPNANLDSAGEAELLACVHRLKELGSTIIFVTHKTNMLACADKILVLQQGIVQAFGDRDEILAKLYGGPRVVPAQPAPGQVVAQG